MKIEIWSDIACPFCYIGKRKLEKAIQRLPDSVGIVLEWKSFQLNPSLQTDPNQNTLSYLAETKGWTMEQTLKMTAQVTAMGKEEELNFNFEKTAVANTKRSHRLLHLAKGFNCQNELKEQLFKAYFEEGQNIDNLETLLYCAEQVGIPRAEAINVLDTQAFEEEIDQDLYESRLIGVQGVPFFVFDRKYGISGAQTDEVFDQTLQQALQGFKEAPNT
jgi:predicted DsbA family dithiol-disulfide isomerase